jgi:glycosyltransferase involved in cell wall biosynthesis
MRVLHVNTEKGWRGGERQTLLTALEQQRKGVEARIACRRGAPLEEAANAEHIPVVSLSSALPSAFPALGRAADACDVLHCHTGRGHSLAVMATLWRRPPLVISRRVVFVPRASWFNRWKYRRADRVVCVSEYIARLLREWGVPPEKLSVIYDAVPGDALLPREACLKELRARTGVSAGQRLVGNIAALTRDKDHAILLHAAKVVAAQRPDVAFVIIGEGELKEELLKLRQELALEHVVHFTGFIPQAQRLLPGFDVFALSTRMEGLGTIVLDAALAGVPVAATAAGGLPEAVLDGQTGLLAPVGDAPALAAALLRLLAEPALAQRLAEAARRRVEQEFSVTTMARRYVDIYQSLLARGAS